MSDLQFLKTQVPYISLKINKIINKYKDLIINDYDDRDVQVLSKFIEDYYEYIFELLFFLCRIKNAGYLKRGEDKYFVDNYLMPKINNDIFRDQNEDDASRNELKYYLKKFFIKCSDKFISGEHLTNTEFNIKIENLMEYINKQYKIKCY